jgi:hypothetical protein
MADRHQHRHGGQARSSAQPYASTGRSHATDRVAYRAGAHENQHRESSARASAIDGQPAQSRSATSASAAVDDVAAQPVRSAEKPRSYNSFQSKVQLSAKQTGATSASKKQKRDDEGGQDDEPEQDPSKPVVFETDVHRLEQRQKQIDMGKSTPGYQLYVSRVPKAKRDYERRFTDHPLTPRKQIACSKRSWDGQVRKWRRLLHVYDGPETSAGAGEAMDSTDNAQTQDADSMEDTLQHGVGPPPPTSAPLGSSPAPSFSSSTPAAKFDASHFAAASKSFSPAPSTTGSSASQPPMNVSFPSFLPTKIAPAMSAAQSMTVSGPTMTSHPFSFASPSHAQPAAVFAATPAMSKTAGSGAPSASPPVLFTSSTPQKAAVFEDTLASFDDEDLSLLPPADATNGAATAAHLMDDDELVDYEEDGESAEEIEMRQQALDAAREL